MEKIAYIDKTIEEFIPSFMKDRKKDLEKIKESLEKGDFDEIVEIARIAKDSANGFGFDELTSMALGILNGAKKKDGQKIARWRDEMESYMESVRIVFVDYGEENAWDIFGEDDGGS